MSLFGLFKPQWKKQFDELVRNHRDALEAYIQGRYEVFPDMRVDDRLLFKEYRKAFENAQYAQSIEALSESNKEEISSQADNVIRLYKAFSKYNTKQKRVILLKQRFSLDNVFYSVLSKCDFITKNTNVESLDEEQLDYILGKYDSFVDKATYWQRKKKKKQEKLKQNLLVKVNSRKVDELIKAQKSSELPLIVPGTDNEYTEKEVNKRIDLFKQKYNLNSSYTYIRRALLLGFDSIPLIFRNIYILSREEVFKKGSEVFELVRPFPIRRTYLNLYLRNTTNKEECIKELFINHDFNVIDGFAHKEMSNISGDAWVNLQANFNESVLNIAPSLLHDFRTPNVGTYVTVIYGNGIESRKYFSFIHLIMREYRKTMGTETLALTPYMNYTTSENYRKCVSSFERVNPSTNKAILNFIFTLRQKNASSFAVVLGSSNVEDAEEFNKFHFSNIKEKLSRKNVQVVDFSDIDKLDFPKYIVILELFTETKQFRETGKKILYKFPGVSMCYLSIYNEMTKTRFNEYQSEQS